MSESGSAGRAVREVSIVRLFDAPRERVWRAWTEPEEFASWFSTPPNTTPASGVAMDVRPGGTWRATQVSSVDGTELPFVGTYREVREPERLVFTFEDPEDRSAPYFETATVTLSALDGRTEMAFEQIGHLPEEQYPLLEKGYAGFFDQLALHLAAT
jgi:uncharacterized protein YndB with AHSA1/START domain